MQRLSEVAAVEEIRKRIEARTGATLPPPTPPKPVSAYYDDDPEVQRMQADLRRQSHLRRLEWARQQSIIGERFMSRTFATFEVDGNNRNGFEAAQAFVAGKTPGLGFTGPVGAGKTHLAAAIANAAIERGRVAVCVPVHQLLAKIRASYNGGERDEATILAHYAAIDVLILDDLGKEPATRWSVETLFALVDRRYEQNKGLVVTTNHDPAQLNERYSSARDRDGKHVDEYLVMGLVDRVMEMTSFPWVRVRGRSHRSNMDWATKGVESRA
jgi:DNA replication protein DnaC